MLRSNHITHEYLTLKNVIRMKILNARHHIRIFFNYSNIDLNLYGKIISLSKYKDSNF